MNNQRGDTIVEVMIALTILGAVVVGSLSLATMANKQVQDGKDRTQMAALMQEQAEALRNLRDNSTSWNAFKSALPASTGQNFRMVLSGNQWTIQNCLPLCSSLAVAGGSAQIWINILDPNRRGGQEIEYQVTAFWDDAANPSKQDTLVAKSLLVNTLDIHSNDCSVGSCP